MEIALYVLIMLIAAWLILDIIHPLFCRAFMTLFRWYIQGVVDGRF